MKYVSKNNLKPLKFVPQWVSSHEDGSTAIEIRKQIHIKEHKIDQQTNVQQQKEVQEV